jgi:hypothetical protein
MEMACLRSFSNTRSFSATGGAPQFGITKEKAVEQIGALTRDHDFIRRYLSGDLESTAKVKTLHAAAHR